TPRVQQDAQKSEIFAYSGLSLLTHTVLPLWSKSSTERSSSFFLISSASLKFFSARSLLRAATNSSISFLSFSLFILFFIPIISVMLLHIGNIDSVISFVSLYSAAL